jgi:hypothetical protein
VSVIRMPIKHYGLEIGEAVVDEDGVMTIVLNGSSIYLGEFGRNLHHFATDGLVTGLSLSPIMPPAVQNTPANVGSNFGPRKPIIS